MEKKRDFCQHPQYPFHNLTISKEGRYRKINDRDYYLNESENFWISRHNGFFKGLEKMLQTSSISGYTHLRICLPKVVFNTERAFSVEVENLYRFLESFFHKRGISFSWEQGLNYAWRNNINNRGRGAGDNSKGSTWIRGHNEYPLLWFGKKSQICQFQVAILDWSMNNGI